MMTFGSLKINFNDKDVTKDLEDMYAYWTKPTVNDVVKEYYEEQEAEEETLSSFELGLAFGRLEAKVDQLEKTLNEFGQLLNEKS